MESEIEIRKIIDSLCDEFEERWGPETRPDFDSFLIRVQQKHRNQLLRALLQVDLELRLKAGQQFEAADYLHLGDQAIEFVRQILHEMENANREELEATQSRSTQSPDGPSRQIGPYKLLQQIGEGGMGTVWMAEQEKPIRRRVALKLIKAGVDNEQVVARFEAERQALAMMDHQNIAKVLDVGVTDDGRPYFAMELVQGIPFTKYCDQNRLSINERLELFVPVCKAIQHAHQKGIIHRDIKPSNVLVCLYDGKPVPKVIDFGLAKALQHQSRLTDKTMFTEFGQVVGTLQYMSPEQAEMNQLDIDTRTDVYSLGVMLYELLTGSTPIEQDSLKNIAILKILETIREKDPPRPSARLSSSTNEAITGISGQRRIDANKLKNILLGELDWIVMKALEKDRTRRYETANGFADDIENYLTGEVVEARPPSTAYRLKKFVKKNRGLVTAGASIFLLLVAGIAGTSTGLYYADIARKDAVDQKKIAIQKTIDAEEEKKRASEEAENAKRSAKRSADVLKIVTDSFQSTNPEEGANADMTAKEVLLNAKSSLESSDLDDEGKVLLLNTLSVSFTELGEYALAISTAREELAIRKANLGEDHPYTLDSQNDLALAYLNAGKLELALPLINKALAVQRVKLGDDHIDTIQSIHSLATFYMIAGQSEEALPLFEKVLDVRKQELGHAHPDTLNCAANLAASYLSTGRLKQSVALLEQILGTSKVELGKDHPFTLKCMNNLAMAYESAGKLDDEVALLEQALALNKQKHGDDHPQTLSVMGNLANAYHSTGKLDMAVPLLEQILAARKAKLGEDHPETLTSMNSLADGLRSAGRLDEAISLFEQTLVARKAKLGEDHPRTLSTMNYLAIALRTAGRLDEAASLFEQTLVARKTKLGEDHPDTLTSMHDLAITYRLSGRIDDAIPLFEQVVAARGAKLGENHRATLDSMNVLALAYQSVGRFADAVTIFERCRAGTESILGENHLDTITIGGNLAAAYRSAGRLEEAVSLYEQILDARKAKLGEDHPKTLFVMHQLADAFQSVGRLDDARKFFEQVLALRKVNQGEDHPETTTSRYFLADIWLQLGQPENAEPLLRENVEIQKRTAPDAWTTFHDLSKLGEVLLEQKRFNEAESLLNDAHTGMKERADAIPESIRVRLFKESVNRLLKLAEAMENSEDVKKWQQELEGLTDLSEK